MAQNRPRNAGDQGDDVVSDGRANVSFQARMVENVAVMGRGQIDECLCKII